MLNNREWATLFWIVVVLVVVLLRPGGRGALGQFAKALFIRPLILLTGLLIAWIALVVVIGRAAGLWDLDLTKDTLIWAVTVGLPLLFKSAQDATKAGYYRRQVKQTVEMSAFMGFYLNLVSAPLLAEIVLQPILVFVALAPTLTRTKKELARYQRFYDRLAAVVGLIFFAAVGAWLIGDIHTLDPRELSLSFLLPIWLTIGVLPIIYVFSILFSYQSALLRLRWHSEDRRSKWKAQLALVLGFRLGLRDLGAPGQGYQWGLAHSVGLRDGLRVTSEFRRSLREQEAAERRRLANLKEFACVEGTDEEGRQLDQREFAETRETLDWLATCQMGWYNNQGHRYRDDLLKILDPDFARKGLPADHGIQLLVRRDGQAWYAWRRTITGWCFAIGAAKVPPDQWHCDGPEPPRGSPGRDPSWGSGALDDAINW
jgi:hypothetical protein